jgi:hypothetical protein
MNMGCYKRAVFSNIHHKKRFVLMLLILLVASVFLQVSYQIRENALDSVAQIRKDIGASVIVHVADAKFSGRAMTSYFSYDVAREISELPEVQQTKYTCVVNALSDDIDGIEAGMDEAEHELRWPGVGDFQLVGVSDMQSFWNFRKGKDHLLEGRLLSPSETGLAAVLSQRVFSFNALRLGDTFKMTSYFDHNLSIELSAVGVHSGDDLNLVPECECNINFI